MVRTRQWEAVVTCRIGNAESGMRNAEVTLNGHRCLGDVSLFDSNSRHPDSDRRVSPADRRMYRYIAWTGPIERVPVSGQAPFFGKRWWMPHHPTPGALNRS